MEEPSQSARENSAALVAAIASIRMTSFCQVHSNSQQRYLSPSRNSTESASHAMQQQQLAISVFQILLISSTAATKVKARIESHLANMPFKNPAG